MGKSTAKIFTILGLIIVALFYAVGLLYALRGNIYLTAVLAILPVIAYVFLGQQMEAKKQKEGAKTQEIIFGAVYGVIALAFFVFFFHSVDVEFNRKNAIKKAAYDKLSAVDQLFKDYGKATERELNSFNDKVESALSAYFLNFSAEKRKAINKLLGEGSVSFNRSKTMIETQAKEAVAVKQEVMRNGYDLGSDLEEEWTSYQERIRPDIDHWNRLNISFAYYDIDNMYKKVYDQAMLKMPSFGYHDLESEDIALDKPLSALGRSLGAAALLFLLYLLVHGFILMPYILAKRPAKKNRHRDQNESGRYQNEVNL